MYFLGKVELPVSTLNLFENIIVCKIQKLSGHWALGNLQYLWVKSPRKTFTEIADSAVFMNRITSGSSPENSLARVIVLMPPWIGVAATIAGQCFSPKGLGLRLGILREEPCMVGLASEFPTNLEAWEGAGSSLFFLGRESQMPWEVGCSRILS